VSASLQGGYNQSKVSNACNLLADGVASDLHVLGLLNRCRVSSSLCEELTKFNTLASTGVAEQVGDTSWITTTTRSEITTSHVSREEN
jgi:hypothetical protein